MAKTSVFSRPLPNASLPRNSFSRGFVSNLNWSAGMIIPVFCKEVPKGSHGRINRSIFMRTAQLNTAAFPKMDNHIDFFKIPKRLLLSRYEEIITNTQDNFSSAIVDSYGGNSIPTTMPYFKRSDVLGSLFHYDEEDSEWYAEKDILGYETACGSLRLLDLLGYDGVNCMKNVAGQTPASTDPFECNLNAMRLLAYHKVYYDHYRNTAYEANDPRKYNADYTYQSNLNSSGAVGLIGGDDLTDLLTMHYVNMRKDYFMNIYPSLNYVTQFVTTSASPSFTGLEWSLPTSVSGLLVGNPSASDSSYQGTVYATGVASGTNTSSTSVRGGVGIGKLSTSYQSGISVQSIRAAFALDKLLRASAYAPKHVRDQIEARFGVKTRKTYGHESEYLGSFMNDIVVGEVTSTANTTSGDNGDALGAIGGKGVSGDRSGKVIEFDTNEDDCIIMGVMYTLVRSVYDSTRIDKFNTKFAKEDYFQPEFMDLGLQPLYQFELETVGGVNGSTYSNQIRGYVPRYQEYKTSIDENHGLFNAGNQLDIFVPHINKINTLALSNGNGVNVPYFKMDPAYLDSIFVDKFSAVALDVISDDPYATELTDQFYGELQFQFDVRQNMSVHGQPRL